MPRTQPQAQTTMLTKARQWLADHVAPAKQMLIDADEAKVYAAIKEGGF